MKILYDYQIFFSQNYGGISKCFAELISHLPKNVDSIIGIKESNNIYLKELGLVPGLKPLHWTSDNFIFPFYSKIQKKLLDWSSFISFFKTPYNINKNYSIELLKKGDFDVFHPTDFEDYYLPYIQGKPFIFTIHDMIPELMGINPNVFQCRQKRLLAKKATHIIAVSENTKSDIMKILDIPEEKISVIYHAADTYSNFSCDVRKKNRLPQKYFLYVGGRNSYKSFQKYLMHVATFFNENKDVYLICSGNPFNKDELKLIDRLGLNGQIKSIFFSTEELMYAYANAIAFVFPSQYEGFGIPILEALAMKCPVLLNNASCFPEIAQNSAIYFNLDDSESCTHALEYIYNLSPIERSQLILNGTERAKFFSWEKSARQLTEVYKKFV